MFNIQSHAFPNIYNNIMNYDITVQGTTDPTIKNNIVRDKINFYSNSDGEAINNICEGVYFNSLSNAIEHDNYITSDYEMENNVFVWTGSDDAKFDFKTGSPALGYCQDGADCGAFGGTTPYRLSGIPARPRVTLVQTPGTVIEGQTGMSVKVTAEGRN